ncbi:HNH endonuclease [Flavobacterium kingsejongi]|uniref:Uncharacterized protein n=1 Tax=Flavobacterium kingsejongi TaxID=1678728 RepID=A0A2S1LTK5_9FLAO|nr:HNH endonuclease [Flavobacterium kingsejongi]AWG27095.1 hypothetical protein FK004_18665 [Flavobacterium kingsejongi]
MGIKPSVGEKILVELKLTWHHLDDLDENLKGTMQLIQTDIHIATLPHKGSPIQIKTVLDIK